MPRTKISVTRFHDISVGHTVCGHEGKCIHLHGHNYRIHFKVEADDSSEQLDDLGRVLDFSVIKSLLCEWLENNWDHRFLVYMEDARADALQAVDHHVVLTPFNPTAENMAMHLLTDVGPMLLARTDCKLVEVKIEETYKCSAEVKLG